VVDIGQKIVGLHLSTKARELPSFRNFVPKLLSRVIIGEIRKSCGTRSWSASGGRGTLSYHALDDRHEGGVNPMQWRQPALAGLCRLYWYPLYIFAQRRGYSPAEINEEIHAFREALIGTGRP
jgi:hypothetical protein